MGTGRWLVFELWSLFKSKTYIGWKQQSRRLSFKRIGKTMLSKFKLKKGGNSKAYVLWLLLFAKKQSKFSYLFNISLVCKCSPLSVTAITREWVRYKWRDLVKERKIDTVGWSLSRCLEIGSISIPIQSDNQFFIVFYHFCCRKNVSFFLTILIWFYPPFPSFFRICQTLKRVNLHQLMQRRWCKETNTVLTNINKLGGNSQNFLCKFLIFFVTLGLKILRL